MSTLRVAVSCGGRGHGHEPPCRSVGTVLRDPDRDRHDPISTGPTDGDILSTGALEYPDGWLTTAAGPGRVAGRVADRFGDLAVQVFRALDRVGLPRVDTLTRAEIDSRVEVSADDVDTMPSLAEDASLPLMWQAAGLAYPQLMDLLIETADGRVGTAPRRTGGNPR